MHIVGKDLANMRETFEDKHISVRVWLSSAAYIYIYIYLSICMCIYIYMCVYMYANEQMK